MVLFFAFGGYVGLIFTRDPAVVRIVARLAMYGALYQIPDCIYGSVSGILRQAPASCGLPLPSQSGLPAATSVR